MTGYLEANAGRIVEESFVHGLLSSKVRFTIQFRDPSRGEYEMADGRLLVSSCTTDLLHISSHLQWIPRMYDEARVWVVVP